jgi:hypothetical protein
VKVKYAKKAISASGYEKSILKNFNFNDVDVNAATAGEVSYAETWNMKNVSIKAMDKSKVVVKNSSGLVFDTLPGNNARNSNDKLQQNITQKNLCQPPLPYDLHDKHGKFASTAR